ncbi:uncharacterized protein LOC132696016 isoform X2 [Cylas formicarius]|uniref:uncharacterized protein LOC132696016 isoform X2 n=1 Tax=Cylas formicarius TaxID=197179 RepID=UPI0029585650|nr:uncharacterized protein LOC132696016 isoform X2 [Cylas formicarius]
MHCRKSDLHSDELDRLFEKAINIGDHRNIIKLSTECIKYNKCPSLPILIQVLSICSENGDKQTITEIVGLCEKNQPEILDDNSYFQHYLAEAIWIKGNIIKSLRLFEQVYKENQFLRRRIRLMLQSLIADSILNHSEAALLNIKIFCEKLAKEYNDYHPLSCIWQSCMLSEWYTDQCLALDLLMENCGLRKALSNRINFAVNSLLNTHSTDIVYRLIEILLKCDMRSEAAGVLLAMFDYWIRNCNMTRCNEIVKWTIEQDIELPAAQQDKFVRLLLGEKIEVTKNKKRTYDKTPPNYRF